MNYLVKLFPNLVGNMDRLIAAIGETLIMVFVSGTISIFFGLGLGIVLVITRQGGILENKYINLGLERIISIFRSIPFIILLAALLPVSRLLVGTGIGTRAALFPLVVAGIPFLGKQIESALLEVDQGLIEAAESMGSGPLEIIVRVYLREAIKGIIRGISISLISLIGLSAVAGNIGGGGLGDFAIRYGYGKSQHDITYGTILILMILVLLIQKIANILIKKFNY